MIFKRRQPEQPVESAPTEPVPVGEVIDQLFDLEGQEVQRDPEAELARKRLVISSLKNAVQQARAEEIDKKTNKQEYDEQMLKDLGDDLLQLTMREQALEQPDSPPDNPRP